MLILAHHAARRQRLDESATGLADAYPDLFERAHALLDEWGLNGRRDVPTRLLS